MDGGAGEEVDGGGGGGVEGWVERPWTVGDVVGGEVWWVGGEVQEHC